MMTPEADAELTLSSSATQAVGPYLQAVRRHWRLVVLVGVLATAVAAVTLERSGKTYSADASILVAPLPEGAAGFVGIATVFDSGDPANTVQTAAALIDTPNAAALAAKQLGKPWTTGAVSAAVTVTPRGASDVLAVSGQASTPAAAARVANAFAASAIAYRASLVQQQIQASITQLEARMTALRTSPGGTVEVTALATAVQQLSAVQGPGREPTMSVSQTAQPGSPTGASTSLIVLLAIVGGFALGSIAALGLETFSRPVRDREEITTIYPMPVLATLPEIDRSTAGRTPPWVIPPVIFEQLRMLRVQLSLSDIGRVIMVTSAGAGDGKTTVAAALAAAFAEADMSATLMDLDMRKPGLQDLLEVSTSPGLWSPAGYPVPRLPGVRLIPPPSGGIAEFEKHVERLPTLLLHAGRTSDVVIIDTAPVGEASETLRIASICDQVLFVARPRFTDRRRLVLARDLLARVESRPVGLVLVGKETGHPRGHEYAYGYSMSAGSQLSESKQRPAAVSSGRADADELELD
jgi:Mrp family chromosome partitioning ATPase/capsular polysaccharide biosynthesis protein